MPAPKDAETESDRPDARQLLHAATGDRDAEARALAERADEDVDDAKTAVAEAHGDVAGHPKPERDVAIADDAREAAERASGDS
jgi:hypothetical protein